MPVRAALEQATVQAGVPEPLRLTVVVACLALALGLAGEILAFPFVCRAEWLLERRYGLSRVRFGAWWRAYVRAVLLTGASWVVAAVVVYAAIVLWPAHWWLAVGAAFAAGTVALAVWGPAFLRPVLRARPVRRRELATRLEALARRANAPIMGVYEWPEGEVSRANAALVGVGSARRVLVSDTLVEDASDAEIEVVLAHELAHHVHGDIWKTLAFRVAVVCGACWVAARTLIETGPALGLVGVADAAGLPVLALAIGVVVAGALPVANLLSRRQERRADRYALDLTGNHEAFVSGLRRLGTEHLVEERPTRFVEWCFHSHPPVAERMAAARRHRAETRSGPPAQTRNAPVRTR